MSHDHPIRSSVPSAFAAAALGMLLATGASAQCPNSGFGGGSLPAGPARFVPADAGASSGSSRSGARTAQATATSGLFGATKGANTRCARTARGVSGRLAVRGRASTAAGAAPSPPSQPDWEAWWEDNRHAYLWDTAVDGAARGPSTAAGARFGSSTVARPDHAPARREVYTLLVPRLLELAASDDDPMVLREVALALGRTVEPPLDAPAAEALIDLLGHHDLGVQACAAMGLGLLGGEEGFVPLTELAACSQVGHRLSGRDEVPDALRATAAMALGLLDHPEAAGRLIDLAERLSAGDDMIRAGAVLGLGVMHDEHVLAAVPWLTETAGDRAMPLDTQVSVPTSLGRLGALGSRDALAALLADRDSDDPARQSAVVALGSMSTLSDVGTVELLLELVAEERDAGTRRLALLALARLPDGAGDVAATQDDVRRALQRAVSRPARDADRPWGALAAGLWVRVRPTERLRFADALLAAYDDQSDPTLRGAHALALGLAHIVTVSDRLAADFDDTRDEALRGHLAVALGLLGAQGSSDRLRDALLADGTPAWLRTDLAEALRLLGDEQAVGAASLAFSDAGSSDARRGLAAALGTLRNGEALALLTDAATDPGLDPTSRAQACAALGRLGEKTLQPWYARLTLDGNPMHPHAVLTALAGDS